MFGQGVLLITCVLLESATMEIWATPRAFRRIRSESDEHTAHKPLLDNSQYTPVVLVEELSAEGFAYDNNRKSRNDDIPLSAEVTPVKMHNLLGGNLIVQGESPSGTRRVAANSRLWSATRGGRNRFGPFVRQPSESYRGAIKKILMGIH